jgi:hypothetical protein
MATQIVATNVVSTSTSGSINHRHISEVKTADGRVLSRSEVVVRIQLGIEEFCTKAGGEEAGVIVVSCPFCTSQDYIKTTADSTVADNLLSLPSFTS